MRGEVKVVSNGYCADYLAGELYKQDQILDAARAAITEILKHRKPSRKMLLRALRILEGKPLK